MAGLGQLVNEGGLISDVLLQEHGPRHASMEILTENPADSGALMLLVLLDDHAAHADINADDLARVEGHAGVLH